MEVAGLVLGAVPLLLTALDQYSKGFDTLRSIAKYRVTFSEIVVSFRTSVSIYTYDCEDLFCQRLMLSDEKFRGLMEHTEKWDQSVVEKLEYALGKPTCGLYKQLLLHLNRKMGILHRKLELGPDGNVPFIKDGVIDEKECKEFFRGWKRIKGISLASRIEKYKKLVAEIEADINKIHELTTRAVAAEDRRRPQETMKEIPQYWLDMRQNTSALFINLNSSWPDSCSAPHTHHVQLLVGFPGTEKKKEGTSEFRLSFSLQGHQQANGLPWEHRAATMLSETQSTLCVTKPTGGRKAVTFTVDDSAQEQKRCSSKRWIFNFCAALTASTGCCLGILRHKDHVYHVHDVEDAKPQKLSLLQDLIDKREFLLQRKRCDLALALAYAVLQLGKTPWLRSRWNLKDVHFSESGTHHSLWISKSFCPGTSTESAGEAKKQSIIKNDSLFSLGVALLELAYCKPLSSFQTDDAPDDKANQHDLTRYLIADRLTKKLLDEDSPNFASAVSSCIDPVSETREFDLANEGFRKRYFKEVILPLQEDYDQLFRRKT